MLLTNVIRRHDRGAHTSGLKKMTLTAPLPHRLRADHRRSLGVFTSVSPFLQVRAPRSTSNDMQYYCRQSAHLCIGEVGSFDRLRGHRQRGRAAASPHHTHYHFRASSAESTKTQVDRLQALDWFFRRHTALCQASVIKVALHCCTCKDMAKKRRAQRASTPTLSTTLRSGRTRMQGLLGADKIANDA